MEAKNYLWEVVSWPPVSHVKFLKWILYFLYMVSAIEESNITTTRPQEYQRRHLQIVESSQKWLALHFGYCLHYSKKRKEAMEHCQQVKYILEIKRYAEIAFE